MSFESTALALFSLSTALVLYVLLGYPLLLGLLAKLAPAPAPRRHWRPRTVSVLLPVRDGERWIRAKLEAILRLDYPHELLQIIVIDDGSKDDTARVARSYQTRGVEIIEQPAAGKPTALNSGMARATGEILFFTDVRQGLEPNALKSLVSWFEDPTVGVVSGELLILRGDSQEEADIGLYWRLEKWLRKRLSVLHSVMGATGSIYAMRRELAAPLPPDTLVDDMHLPLTAFFKGYRVLFDQDARAYDYPTGLSTEFRRKVRTLAGNYQILYAFPRLLLPGHRMWLHFLSHKVGRLLLPFALLTMAACTPFLPRSLAFTAALGQALVYGLAALDLVVSRPLPLKRLTSAARTFVVLMIAAASATVVIFKGAHGLWRVTHTPTRQNLSDS